MNFVTGYPLDLDLVFLLKGWGGGDPPDILTLPDQNNTARQPVRDVTTALLMVKNRSISPLWELNSIFM